MKEYYQKGVKDEELVSLKSAIGQFDALRYETPVQKAQFIRRILDYNLPANYTQQQNKILNSITKAEINSITRKYIQPDKMNILLVGDKARILPGVKKLGFDIIELDVDGNKLEKKGF